MKKKFRHLLYYIPFTFLYKFNNRKIIVSGNRRPGQKEDILETQSKLSALSIGSSRSGHSRSGKKRHKKPTRRRPRQPRTSSNGTNNKHEPVYNNVVIGKYLLRVV